MSPSLSSINEPRDQLLPPNGYKPPVAAHNTGATTSEDDEYSNLTIFGLSLGGTAVFVLCLYLLYRLFKCSRRRLRPQNHSRRHSQSFSHTIYQTQNYDGSRRVSNYSFPLPSRLPTYQQATHLRSPSRARDMQSVGNAWPLNSNNQNLGLDQRHVQEKLPSPTSAVFSTPSEISVASTLVAMPLPAHSVDFTARRHIGRPYVVSPISTEGIPGHCNESTGREGSERAREH